MGGCQNYGPFLGTLYIYMRCRIIIGIQKGTIISITTHIGSLRFRVQGFRLEGFKGLGFGG